MKSAGQSSIIAKSTRILDLLAESGGDLGFSDIVNRTGLVKSSTHRILSNLVAEDLVEFDHQSRRYRPGSRLLRWAIGTWQGADIQQAAAIELKALAQACGDNVSLAVPDENGAIYLRTVNNYQPRFVARSGDRAILHCTAVGKLIVAFQSEAQREHLLAGLSFERYTENTVTDRARFERELEDVIAKGYAVCDGEEFIQVCGVACPVFDFDGALAGCINLWSLTERSSLEDLRSRLPLLKTACRRVSQKLGYVEAENRHAD